MRTDYVFKNVDHNEDLITYIEKRKPRLIRTKDSFHLHWIFSKEKQGFQVELLIKGKGADLVAHAIDRDLHKAVDTVISKAKILLVKKKGKIREKPSKKTAPKVRKKKAP